MQNYSDQDYIHNHKKVDQHLDHQARMLYIGRYPVHRNFLWSVLETFTVHQHGLRNEDFKKKDVMNWAYCQRTVFPKVTDCILDLYHGNNAPVNHQSTISTINNINNLNNQQSQQSTISTTINLNNQQSQQSTISTTNNQQSQQLTISTINNLNNQQSQQSTLSTISTINNLNNQQSQQLTISEINNLNNQQSQQ